jgi:hypothetical protein
LAIQVNQEGLFFDNIKLPLDVGDMLLYPDSATAPRLHLVERPSADRESRAQDDDNATFLYPD